MTSERQIAANRRNAQKSSGPKSKLGKKRSSMNALRHGLSVPIDAEGSEAPLDELMRQFAPDASDERSHAEAQKAAGAQLELTRVKRVQNTMIEHALTLFASDPELFDIDLEEARQRIKKHLRQAMRGDSLPGTEPKSLKPLPGGKEEEERWHINAVRCVLPELIRIGRYERRATSCRDRALGKSLKSPGPARRRRKG